jgi:outer membrane protein assembly factor BamB
MALPRAAALVPLASIGLLAAGCRTPALVDPLGGRAAPPRSQALFSVDWWTSLVVSSPAARLPELPRGDLKVSEAAPAAASFSEARLALWDYAPREPASPALDPATGRLIVLTRDGQVRAVGEGGEVAWAFQTRGAFGGGPTVHEGIVYVPGGDGVLYAADVKTGALKWTYEAKEELATSPVVASGKVLVASQSDVVFAVDAATGEWSWQYRRDTPSGFTIRGAARPAVRDGVAYAGFSDGYLVALRVEDGTVKWERSLVAKAGGQYVDVDTSPVLDDAGKVYAASYKDGLYALDAETGAVRWHAAVAGAVGLLAAGEMIFTAGDQHIGAHDASTGRQHWTAALPDRAARPPALVRGYLLVPVDTALLFVDPVSGLRELSWDPGQGVTATPLVRGPHAYVLSNLGYLYALNLGRSG